VGLLRAVGFGGGGGGWLQEVLERELTGGLGVADELRFSLTEEMCRERAVRHSVSAMMREMGIELSDMLNSPNGGAPPAAAKGSSRAPTAEKLPSRQQSDDTELFEKSAGEGVQWERFQGSQHLQSPPALNSRQLRTACIPGVSAHGSARGLAAFYAAFAGGGSGPSLQLPRELLAQVAMPRTSGELNGGAATWGLGVQLGEVVDQGGRKHVLLGHLGLGGSVGLCVPECGVAVAVTVSQLSTRCDASRRLVELLLRECGLSLQPGFFPDSSTM